MDAQIRRRRTFEAIKKLFLRESLNQPLILIFEDLHWVDSETQGFLDTLSESVASAKVLLLVNYRPEYRQEWGQKTYYTQLRLAPLGKEEAEELLDVSCWVPTYGRPAGPCKTSNTSFWRRPKARRSSWKRWCRPCGGRCARGRTRPLPPGANADGVAHSADRARSVGGAY